MTFTVIWLAEAMVAYRRIRGTDSDAKLEALGAPAIYLVASVLSRGDYLAATRA
jgi:hypothetical protein